ncbi:hypothetical protein BU14_1600s0002 [Porphyra umbilicalis]|uniref:Uncharacterized protein n=1 Tax=Porphyra umbilicalis TaxID=2786 RepID=A0A1X6NL75_PORUM|nr:hypothetical protein BU14_1600s0002 [Porphyra umbilicalis]|eukprot:OSX69348.1 hypothetical protein BU14_1600s0002 [Porphyra umbilicalis]
MEPELPTTAAPAAAPSASATAAYAAEAAAIACLGTGRYLSMEKDPAAVRSTISLAVAADGSRFASTHGDTAVRVWDLPSGLLRATLHGHPRTPWTVRWHPAERDVLASGCLGQQVRVWRVDTGACTAVQAFPAEISGVAFHPAGDVLAVGTGRRAFLWRYAAPDSTPVEVLNAIHPLRLVDFHPTGELLLVGRKNQRPVTLASQFTLKLDVHRFTRHDGPSDEAVCSGQDDEGRHERPGVTATNTGGSSDPSGGMAAWFGPSVLTIPAAVAYNDAGVAFSPCGKMLAACIPAATDEETGNGASVAHAGGVTPAAPSDSGEAGYRIAILSLCPSSLGNCIASTPLDEGHTSALTNLCFSPTSGHLLAGFSFRPSNPHLRAAKDALAAAVAVAAQDDGNALPSGPSGAAEHCVVEPQGATAHVEGDSLETPASPQPVSATKTAEGSSAARPAPPTVPVVDIFSVEDGLRRVHRIHAGLRVTGGGVHTIHDEINCAVFASQSGADIAVIYGTQQGLVRVVDGGQQAGSTTGMTVEK